MRRALIAGLAASLAAATRARALAVALVPVAAKAADLSDPNAAAALKEALQVSVRNAVSLTGRVDGFFGNDAIRILMPERLRLVEQGLRAVGYGKQVDDFVLSMNRAAEKAVPAARDIFTAAIRQIGFDDARRILTGGDTAATDYFREKTSDRLKTAFRPIVEKSMRETGATRRYEDLLGRFRSLPLAGRVSFDVNGYVVEQALAGLFHVVGEQEKQIRTDPAARATDLLKRAFGR